MAFKTSRGTWRVLWRHRGRRLSKNFNNKALADKFEAKLRVEGFIYDPKAESDSPTFKEFSNQWFENYCKVEKRETQWIEDLRIIKRSLIPAFGSVKLSELRKSDLENLKIQLRKKIKRNKGEAFIKPRTSIQMTLRYSHLHPDHLRGVTDVLCDNVFEAQLPANASAPMRGARWHPVGTPNVKIVDL